jgi:hypothetical protein
MRANSSFFFTVIALTIVVTPLIEAQTPINTVPEGAVTYTLPAAGGITYLSTALEVDPVYTGAVGSSISVTANTISVDGTAPWTANQFASASSPYFVKFLSTTGSGNSLESGRILLIQSNTTNTLTLDTTDHFGPSVPLTTTGFSVVAGDTFEIFSADTLGTMFIENGTPILTGGTTTTASDIVSLYSQSLSRFVSYYYNTTAGFWEQIGTTTNANNTIIYPYSSVAITRRTRSGQTALPLTLMGRVPSVSHLIKAPANTTTYNSTGYPVDMKLSQLNLGTTGEPWTEGATAQAADMVAVWNASLSRFDSYFQLTDGTWRKVGGGPGDVSTFTIPAGNMVIFVKRSSGGTGAGSFLVPAIPYTTSN